LFLVDRSRCRGFSLIELLVVIAILAALLAILFPVFNSSRGKSREAVCLSNLRQIGMSVHAYASDNDDSLPLGADFLDKKGIGWSDEKLKIVQAIPLLPDVLLPYTKSKEVWRCPADTGFKSAGPLGEIPIEAAPSSFEQYGMSYNAETEYVLEQVRLSSFISYSKLAPHTEHSGTDTIYLYDASGYWHMGTKSEQPWRCCLYLDGHVKFLGYQDFNRDSFVTAVKP